MAQLRHQRSRGQLTIQGTPRLSPIASIVSSPSLSSPSSEGESFNEDDLITPTADNIRMTQPSLEYFDNDFQRRTSLSAVEKSPMVEQTQPDWLDHKELRKTSSVGSLRSEYSHTSQSSNEEPAGQRNSKLRKLLLSRSRPYTDSSSGQKTSHSLDVKASASASEESLWGTPVDADAVAQGLVAAPAAWSPDSSSDSGASGTRSASVAESIGTVSTRSSGSKNEDHAQPLQSPLSQADSEQGMAVSQSRDTSLQTTVDSIESSLKEPVSASKPHNNPLVTARSRIVADTKLLITKSIQKTCDRCHRSQKGLWIWTWTSQLLCLWCLDVQAKRVPFELKTHLLDRAADTSEDDLEKVDQVALSRIANSLPHIVLAGLVPGNHRKLKARPSAPDDSFIDMRSRGASKQLRNALHSISSRGRYGLKLKRSAAKLSKDGLATAMVGSLSGTGRVPLQCDLDQCGRGSRRVSSLLKGQSLLPYRATSIRSSSLTAADTAARRQGGGHSTDTCQPNSNTRDKPASTAMGRARSMDTYFSSGSDLSPQSSHSSLVGSNRNTESRDGHEYPRDFQTSSEILNADARFRQASGVYVGMLEIDWRASNLLGNPQSSSAMVLYTYPDEMLVCTGCCANNMTQDDFAYISRSGIQEHCSLAHGSQLQEFVPFEGDTESRTSHPLTRRPVGEGEEAVDATSEWWHGNSAESVRVNSLGLTSIHPGSKVALRYEDDDDDDAAMTYY